MATLQFILGSASPARLRLLQSVGINAIVRPSDFDESQVQIADPAALVETLALSKARAVVEQLDASPVERLVLGCDSVLAIKGDVHGKPANAEEAIARWQQMRGQIGSLYTGHALLVIPPTPPTVRLSALRLGFDVELSRNELRSKAHAEAPHPTPLVRCQITRVHFANVSDRQIAAYVATGEPLHCAGAFALEGKGGSFVEKLEGCHSNVIGLSLPLLRRMLDELGYDITDLWSMAEAS